MLEANESTATEPQRPTLPSIVRNLTELIEINAKYPTIYADPPWEYENTASRGAAANHYQTLDIGSLMRMPVAEISADNAHLHLWTTNAYLWDAATLIEAWGFKYKSCFVWVKPQLGMGNYWRVSHLLVGMRGNLPFRDRTCRSWHSVRRTVHGRKPFAFRELIERVSPGPYLELYGREEQPNCGWTVYGNQVERRMI